MNKEYYIGYIASWITGLFFLITGLFNLSHRLFLALILTLLGILLLPPVNMKINKIWKLNMNNRVRVLFLFIFLVVGLLVIAGMCNWFYCAVT